MDEAPTTPEPARAVLDFWFGPLDHRGMPSESAMQRWFESDPAFDAEIRARFADELEHVRQHLEWRATADGLLALVIVADQFSRNVHRGSARAFAHDDFALELALDAIDAGRDRALLPIQRVFLYLPLEHAEDLEIQQRSVDCFGALAAEVPAALREPFEDFAAFARAHRDVIARFGRFPHRNRVLGRDSTAAEQAWLEEEAPAWGQEPGNEHGAAAGAAR